MTERAEGFWWVRVRDGVRLPWGGRETMARVFEEFGQPWPRQVLVLGVDIDGAAWFTDPESAESEAIESWGPYLGKEPGDPASSIAAVADWCDAQFLHNETRRESLAALDAPPKLDD